MKKGHRYTVRPLGRTAWATAPTLPEARELQREAEDRGLLRVMIVDEHTETLVGWPKGAGPEPDA